MSVVRVRSRRVLPALFAALLSASIPLTASADLMGTTGATTGSTTSSTHAASSGGSTTGATTGAGGSGGSNDTGGCSVSPGQAAGAFGLAALPGLVLFGIARRRRRSS
jgi:MYXO-CTERM domain-containing protein